jgi:hypothetical protein
MQSKLIRDFALTMQLFLNSLGYFLVTLLLTPDYLLRESRSERIPRSLLRG